MPQRFFWIFIGLLVMWQLISRLAERAAQQQRQKKIAEMSTTRPRTAPPPRRVPVAAPQREPQESMAARRRAQIEELRRRRDVRAGPVPQPPIPVGRPVRALPVPPTRPRPVAPARPVPALRPGPAPRPAPVMRPAPRPAPAPRPPPAPEEPAEPAFEHDVHEPDEPIENAAGALPAVTPPVRRPAAILGERIDRHLLRRAVIYREILDAPVSLRAQGGLPPW